MEQPAEIHQKLIERAQKGDQNAYYRLYKYYVQAIYNVCLRMVANQLDAEDLVQETFISAFKKLNQFRAEASFGSWIKKIAINKSLNFIKKKHPEFRMMDQIKESEIQTTEYLENEKGLFSIAPEKIQAEIKKLPHKARVVLNLYLLENYKHREIAEMLHISESTSKSQYLRAKELLKERLEKKIQYEI